MLGQSELLQRALPALETQLTQGRSRPLHLTTEMLSQEYSEMIMGDKSAAVACPACVTGHLITLVARQEARDGVEGLGRVEQEEGSEEEEEEEGDQDDDRFW